MDKTVNTNRWGWLAAAMPGVARLMADRRADHGAGHVALCWRRGVVEREPGWFFAREGALAVGTPWDDPELANFAALHVTSTQALLIIRTPEVQHGA
jgi:hypothetical protein